MKRLFAAFLLLISSLAFGQERIYFDSRDHRHSSREIFVGQATRPQQLWGDLYFPDVKKDQYPVVILAHASDGIAKWRELDLWKPFWLKKGYAVFIVDTFTPRGVKHTYENQQQIKWHIQYLDYLFALETLGKDPRIDASQIGLMGFSRGAQAALAVPNATIAERYGVTNKYHFTIGFYPGCRHYARLAKANNPILLVIGSADDYTPESVCQLLTDQARSVGGIVEFVSIKGAYHNFDAPYGAQWRSYLETYNKCSDWAFDTVKDQWTNLDGSPLPNSVEYLNGECQTVGKGKSYGATVGATWRSLSKAQEAVDEFLIRVQNRTVASTYITK